MKFAKVNLVLFVVMAVTTVNSLAQEFRLTTTTANLSGSRSLIDLPGLTGNPLAIIVATPEGETATINPHPIGVWYYSGKWNLFNTDQAVMATGLRYKIQFFARPGPQQFLHLVTGENLGTEGSYIDNQALNNNPYAQFKILQNHAPDYRTPYYVNRFEAKAAYSSVAGRWYIANIGGEPIGRGTTYNIVITSNANIIKNDNKNFIENLPDSTTPASGSNVPAGNAGGDLGGTYPDPTVKGLMGKPVSNIAPSIGDILKWTGTEWAPEKNENGIPEAQRFNAGAGLSLNGTTFSAQNTKAMWNANQIAGQNIAAAAPPTTGQVLKWNGTGWAPATDDTGIIDAPRFNAGAGLSLNGNTFSAQNTSGMWNANQIAGRNIATTAPTTGQVLKWNGTDWEPAAENVGAASQTSQTAKPSVLFFNQSSAGALMTAGINSAPIPGLDNQPITISQSSRIVFHTAVYATSLVQDPFAGSTKAWINIEILNSANAVVGRATSDSQLNRLITQNINSVGIGILPAGTYHTRVTINRPDGGSNVVAYSAGEAGDNKQGGIMIIEIFPN